MNERLGFSTRQDLIDENLGFFIGLHTKNIKQNHLSHLDYKITQIQRILWVVFAGVLANLIHVIKTMMIN